MIQTKTVGNSIEAGATVLRSPFRYVATVSPDVILQDLRLRIHRKLIDTLDLTKLSNLEMERVRVEIRRILEDMVSAEAIPLSRTDRDRLVMEVQHEVFGLGPLETLMKDPEISDILVNSSSQIYVERYGKLEKTDVRFRDDAHLMQIIERIVTRVGRRVDESSPMVDARLADGSRVNAIIPPLALDGPVLSIRRFGAERLTINDLIQFNSIPPQMAEVAAACVKSRLNMLVSGGTGAGKTTLLNCLSNYIPENERIVTIEDSAELKLQQEHVVRLETRPPNIEGQGSVTARDLVRNALRMRPDRIVIGEVRGGEALDMMQAMNTGHDGSISTIHANSARDALSRLETMMLMAGIHLPERALREQIASALDVIVQLTRMSDGSRKVIEFAEVTGMEGNTITTQTIFKFEQRGVENGKVVGEFVATGVMPSFMDRLERYGFRIPNTHFLPVAIRYEKKSVMSILLITLFSFLAAMSLIVILFMLPMAVQDSPQARIKRRLTAIGRLDYASKAEIQSLLKTSVYSEVPWLNQLFLANPVHAPHRSAVGTRQCGHDAGTCSCFVVIGAAGVTFFLTFFVGYSTMHCSIFALIALFCPYTYLQMIIWKRLRKFLEQFPDGLDMISQSLQAGMGLNPVNGLCRQGNAGPDGHGILSFY